MVRRGGAGERRRGNRDALTSRPRVERLLDAARAPASPRELAREDAAVDLFHRARLAQDLPVTTAPSRSARTGLKAAAASVAAVFAMSTGVSFAATGHVPLVGAVQSVVHQVTGQGSDPGAGPGGQGPAASGGGSTGRAGATHGHHGRPRPGPTRLTRRTPCTRATPPTRRTRPPTRPSRRPRTRRTPPTRPSRPTRRIHPSRHTPRSRPTRRTHPSRRTRRARTRRCRRRPRSRIPATDGGRGRASGQARAAMASCTASVRRADSTWRFSTIRPR
jgi:hypothetical protein